MAKEVRIKDWKSRLLRKIDPDGNEQRVYRAIAANVSTILTHDGAWAGVLAYDEFAETIVTRKLPPWREWDAPPGLTVGDWTDDDTTRVQCWIADHYAIDVGMEAVLAGVKLAALRTRLHPVRDWIDSLRWDGQKRLPEWLPNVMRCDDTPYSRAIGTAWAVSAVARVYQPGCKVDTVLVLEGKPGIFKSSVLRALVGDEWFLEMSISDVANKDAMQLLRRKWIAEFPEIDGLSRTEQAHVKAYFSRQVDTYRPSFGKGTRDFPRQIVFAATTNKHEYLTDETGGTGRRMWPVVCRDGDVALARSMREQFWAEAYARYSSGEQWHITDPEIRDAAQAEQDARFRADGWEQPVAFWLAKPTDFGSRAEHGVTMSDVLTHCLGIDVGRQTHGDAIRASAVLRRLGWIPGNPVYRNGARVRLYKPVDGAGTNGHTLFPIASPPPSFVDAEPSTEDMFPPQVRDISDQ